MTENKPWYEQPLKGNDPFGWKKLADVKKVNIEWLWHPYIPKGAVTLLAGDGGYGKSWLTCRLAADLSMGRALPGQEPLAPQKVLMISAEDGLGEVIRPKMEMLDANMDMITCSEAGFQITPDTRGHLAAMIQAFDAAVVFLDPLVVYMGGKVDMFRANETRAMMGLLVDVAQHTRCALVAVHHVRKSGEGSLQNKVMGSADFVNGVRSALLVDVSKGGQRYMAHAKSNWSAHGAPLAYSFNSHGFHWQGLYEETGEEKPMPNRNKRGAAIAWLREMLSNGPVPSVPLQADAAEAGFSPATLGRAMRENPGVVKNWSKQGVYYWELCPKEIERLQLEARQGLGETLPLTLPPTPAQPAAPVLAPNPTLAEALRRMELKKQARA